MHSPIALIILCALLIIKIMISQRKIERGDEKEKGGQLNYALIKFYFIFDTVN
jgi:hypothetical protein